MSLYKHMHRLSAARDDESRPLVERIVAAEVLETTARIVYERAQAKAKELREMLPINQEINRLEAIRDNESITTDERYKAAIEVLRLIDAELQRAKKAAVVLLLLREAKQ